MLAQRLVQVHASDSGDTHVEAAKQRLARDDISNVFFYKATGENIVAAGVTNPGSVDLLAVVEAIPLMDASKALSSFASLLTPGGTMAIWFYGRPIFVDPSSNSCATTRAVRCQRIFDEICIRGYSHIRPMRGTHWEQTTTRLFSWLDDLELLPDTWENVRRYKWNADRPLSFYDEAACDHPVVTKHKASHTDTRFDVVDCNFWAKKWDIEGEALYKRSPAAIYRAICKGNRRRRILRGTSDSDGRHNGDLLASGIDLGDEKVDR